MGGQSHSSGENQQEPSYLVKAHQINPDMQMRLQRNTKTDQAHRGKAYKAQSIQPPRQKENKKDTPKGSAPSAVR